MNKHKIAIIGSGPAGYSAAIYTSRAEIETVIYAGKEPGGQLTKTTEIENYPGGLGLTGPELMVKMGEQASKFGAITKWEEVEKISSQFSVLSSQGEEKYDGIIIATGASPRLMGVGEEKYYGKGFSTCAVCDAAFYKGKTVYVVGGGDAAIEDTMALTKFASQVTLLVRRDELRASKAMQKKVLDNPEVKIMWETELVGIKGDERVEKLELRIKNQELREVKAEGLFFAIGHIPATKWLEGSGVELDKKGYIKNGVVGGVSWAKGYPTMTAIPGVVAAGDCVDYRYRQAVTAAGMGVMAALDMEKWLESK